MSSPRASASVAGPEPAVTAAESEAPRSLESLYDEHADFVYRTLISLRLAPHAAEDAMQEVFLVAERRLPEFEGTFFKAWLYRIATSVAQNARRSQWRSKQRAAEVELETLPAAGDNEPERQAMYSERVRLLQRLLAELPEKEREVFILADLEQLSQQHIAEALGVHVNTVAYRLRGARERLERLLKAHQRGARGVGT